MLSNLISQLRSDPVAALASMLISIPAILIALTLHEIAHGYVAKRCGDTTVEVDQVSRSSRAAGASTTRSRQLVRRPLILPHEVMQMRTDEQIVFTAGNPPLRCGRAIWFRRDDMKACVGENRFERSNEDGRSINPRSTEPSTT